MHDSTEAVRLTRSLLLVALAGAAVAAACSGAAAARDGTAAGLPTVFDSTADTIHARTDGDVPVPALRSVSAVMHIAPSIDDTSLFSNVSMLEVDQRNRLWVYDFQGRRLFLFDSTGRLLRRIGRQGQGPGEFSAGSGMVVRPDTGVAVWDSQNARISFFDATGEFRTSWPTPAGFSTNDGLVSDRSGTLYLKRPVTPPREGDILGRIGLVRLRDGGALADSLAPLDLPVPRETYVAVSPDGRGRSATASSYAPNYYWAWHPDGYFAAAHGGRYEIVLERPAAPPIVIHRGATPIPIAPDERTEEKERIIWGMRQTQPGWTWSGPEIPETKAPLLSIMITRDGAIWARVAAPSERIPESELSPQREDGPPVRRFRTPIVYEVFAPDGRFLGRVPMPPRTSIMEADGNNAWGVTRDEDDLPAVVRFRIEPPLHRD
jgi:hypothetical protein